MPEKAKNLAIKNGAIDVITLNTIVIKILGMAITENIFTNETESEFLQYVY